MADLLIRGMEMPDNRYRTVEITFDQDGNPMALADGGDAYAVIPVPDHGPLIDAYELRANHGLGEICESCPVDKRYCQYEMIYTKMEVCGWIDDADTIIPASKEDKS